MPNLHTFPVLAGENGGRDVVLSSPIIMYDHPGVAPESPGDLHDACEIDEILTLRTMTLTDEEKREARATDPRAKAIVDRADVMPEEVFARLHGAVRSLRPVPDDGVEAPADPPAPPDRAPRWWDPGADDALSPGSDAVVVDGVRVARGSRVRLRPRTGGTDAHDMFLQGRTARVEAVLLDVDDERHVAVVLDDDPGADLHEWYGRYHYFAPAELTPLIPRWAGHEEMIIRARTIPPESSRRPRHGRESDDELGEELGREARNGREPGRAERPASFEEIHVLWISEGMSCDGDTISITAAEKPSLEDVLLGLIPGLPKVHLHNKLLSPTQGGEDFLAPFRAAAAGRARAVHPGHRGFDPQPEHHRRRRVLDLVRQRPRHRAAADRELVDRPAGPEGLGGDGGRHLRHLRRDPRDGRQPDRSHGAGRLPGTGASSPPAGCRS